MHCPGSASAPSPAPLSEERRRHERVRERFPVTLQSRGLLGVALARGELRDFDVEGACVESDRPLGVGRAVRVQFALPAALSSAFSGLPCRLPARVRMARKTPRAARPYDLVLKWDDPLTSLVSRAIRRHQREVGSLIALVLIAMVWMKWNSLQFFWYTPVLYFYSFTIAAYFLSRFALAWVHRSPKLCGYEPTVSVVISVRNEEDAIARTVESCFAADYPPEKREVIVVNDGSTDRTASVLEGLKLRHERLKVFDIPPSGKRHGMSTGVRNAAGEIVVFVDSDTFLYPTALRHIVCGFDDPTLGASSGHTEVENVGKNALTGLQDVRYYLSFRMMKSAESVFGAVTCCPGCLSAYRRAYVLEVLDEWLNQKFLGAQATFGDDRSLTNYILRDYRVIYNEDAICSTLVPETWRRYLIQQVRWKKSWLRETLRAARFMHRKHPLAAISFYVAGLCSVLSPLMVFWAAAWAMTRRDAFLLYYCVGLILIGMLQCLYVLKRRPSKRWLLGMLLVLSQIVLMGPQTYYALLTMRRNHWGTR